MSAAARTELFAASRLKFLVAIAFPWIAATPTALCEKTPGVTLWMPVAPWAAEKLLLKFRSPEMADACVKILAVEPGAVNGAEAPVAHSGARERHGARAAHSHAVHPIRPSRRCGRRQIRRGRRPNPPPWPPPPPRASAISGEPSTAAKAPAARAIVKYLNFIFDLPLFLKRPRLRI